MDFNQTSRPIGDRSSANFPLPVESNCLTEQATIATNTDTEIWRSDLYSRRSANDIREIVHRELEKERIRAEIIAEETARRRILEEEVRRELALEREMAMIKRREGVPTFRSSTMRLDSIISVPPLLTNFGINNNRLIEEKLVFPLDREVGLTRGFETLPFQRHPSAKNGESSTAATLHEIKPSPSLLLPPDAAKDNVVVLAKPETSLSGLKRKAPASSASGTGVAGAPSNNLKKMKSNEEWSCALCQVIATCERGLNEHLLGKKHRAREAALAAPSTGLGTCPLPKMRVNTIPGKPSTPILKEHVNKATGTFEKKGSNACRTDAVPLDKGENAIVSDKTGQSTRLQSSPKSAKPKNKMRYWCDMCKVGAHSVHVLNAHKSGKKHLAKLLKVSKLSKTVPQAASVPVVTEGMKDTTVEDKQAEEKEMECAPVATEVMTDTTMEDQQAEEKEMESALVVTEGMTNTTVEDNQVEEKETLRAPVVTEGMTDTTVEDKQVGKKETESAGRNKQCVISDVLGMVQSADSGVIAAEPGIYRDVGEVERRSNLVMPGNAIHC